MDEWTSIALREGSRHYLRFTTKRGSITTKDVNLIPTEPLTVAPFEESTETEDVPSYHGTLTNSLYTDTIRYKNLTGQWQFYYQIDEYCRSPWDISGKYAMTADCINLWYDPARKPATSLEVMDWTLNSRHIRQNYSGYYGRPWNFAAQMQQLTSVLQGQRADVTMPDGDVYHGRVWVSKYDPADDGTLTVTISYDLYPPEDYPGDET